MKMWIFLNWHIVNFLLMHLYTIDMLAPDNGIYHSKILSTLTWSCPGLIHNQWKREILQEIFQLWIINSLVKKSLATDFVFVPDWLMGYENDTFMVTVIYPIV